MNDRLRIPISFKNNSQSDLELYAWLMAHEDKSYIIKKILKEAMKKDKEVKNNGN